MLVLIYKNNLDHLLIKKIYNKSPHERADEHMLSLLVNDIYSVILVQNYNITVQSICTA